MTVQPDILQGLIDHLPAFVFSLDGQYRYTAFNRAHAESMRAQNGVQIEIGGCMLDYMTVPADRENLRADLQRALAGESFTRTLYIGQEGRNRVFLETHVYPQLDAAGAVIGAYFFVLDVTQHKSAEQAAREAEAQLRRTLNAIPVQLWSTTATGASEYQNQAWYDYTGLTEEQSLREGWIASVHPDDRQRTLQVLQNLIQTKSAFDHELRLRRHDGEYNWFLIRSRPLLDESGRLLKWYGTNIEITARKQAEEQLSYQAYLLENISEAVVASDQQYRLTAWNAAAENMYGWKASEVLGKLGLGFTQTEYPGGVDQIKMLAQIAAQDYWRGEATQARKDGSRFPVEISTYVLRDARGEITGYISLNRDITDRKRDQQRIAEALEYNRTLNQELEASVRSLEQSKHDSDLLRQASDMLQMCGTTEEAYTVISQFIQALFPGTAGGVMIVNRARQSVEARVMWGKALASEVLYTIDTCWCLRRGQVYQVNTANQSLLCQHLNPNFAGFYLEVPMAAAGELLGMLHIEWPRAELPAQGKLELAQILAEHIALSLSNIRLRESLQEQSVRDALTGVFNRRYFEETLARELPRAARRGSPVGLIILDVDFFKRINDTFGHAAGDTVLIALSSLLQSNVRSEDLVCRIGGDEFVIILPEASRKIALQRAEAIRSAAAALRLAVGTRTLDEISLSMGVAIFPEQANSSEEFLRQADQALYRAKAAGRNRVEG